jgi:hypothetical protein
MARLRVVLSRVKAVVTILLSTCARACHCVRST